MINIEKLLADHLKKFDSAPFLFVGSGFSRRYIGLEDWKGLLEKFSELLPKDFDYYVSSGEGNLAVVAELMARDFFEIWWELDEFKESREEFKGQVINKTSPLKFEISKYLRRKSYEPGKNQKNDREIDQLKEVVIDGIITTNWDLLLEQLFEEQIQTTYVGQEELLFSNPKEIAEIYKIHGSSLQPNSLVLSEKDYKDFKDRNAYLASKLMTIFIEHPIIFLGYSMSDENIVEILQAITSCLTEENLYKLKDRLIFVQRDIENEGDAFQTTTMLIRDTTLTVTSIRTNDYDKIYKGMSSIKRKIPAKLLRQMKSQIYELVRTNDPNGQIYAAVDLEDDYDPSQIEFVYGVGISEKLGLIGYKGIAPDELFIGVVQDVKKWNIDQIILETLPEALRVDRFVPVFKYFSLCNVPFDELDPKIKANLNLNISNILSQEQKNRKEYVREKYSSIQELEKDYNDSVHRLFELIPLLKPENIDKLYLREFIIKYLGLLNTTFYGTRSKLRKLIRFYDLLVYKDKVRR